MKDKQKLVTFLHNPCTGLPWSDAIRMVSILGVVFAVFYVFHGGYLCATSEDIDVLFGGFYIVVGFSFWFLSGLLWVTAVKATLTRCRIWIGSSTILLVIIIFSTFSRNLLREKVVASALIWILCGAILHCYMLWVVWAFMKTIATDSNDPTHDQNISSDDTRV